MSRTRIMRSGSSPDARRASRLASPLLVFGVLASAALGGAMDPPQTVPGDDVGTLPSMGGGFGPNGWQTDGSIGPVVIGQQEPEIVVLQEPALAITGAADAITSSITYATGNGYTLVEPLPSGDLRMSFHGDVLVGLDAAAFSSGALQAELMIAEPYAPAVAAANLKGQWTQPFALAGGVFDVPTLARGQNVQFASVGTSGDTYRLQLQAQNGVLWALQSDF